MIPVPGAEQRHPGSGHGCSRCGTATVLQDSCPRTRTREPFSWHGGQRCHGTDPSPRPWLHSASQLVRTRWVEFNLFDGCWARSPTLPCPWPGGAWFQRVLLTGVKRVFAFLPPCSSARAPHSPLLSNCVRSHRHWTSEQVEKKKKKVRMFGKLQKIRFPAILDYCFALKKLFWRVCCGGGKSHFLWVLSALPSSFFPY